MEYIHCILRVNVPRIGTDLLSVRARLPRRDCSHRKQWSPSSRSRELLHCNPQPSLLISGPVKRSRPSIIKKSPHSQTTLVPAVVRTTLNQDRRRGCLGRILFTKPSRSRHARQACRGSPGRKSAGSKMSGTATARFDAAPCQVGLARTGSRSVRLPEVTCPGQNRPVRKQSGSFYLKPLKQPSCHGVIYRLQ